MIDRFNVIRLEIEQENRAVDELTAAKHFEVAEISAAATIAAAKAAQKSAYWARVSAVVAAVALLVAFAALVISLAGRR